jgi:hypothetical protein
MINGDRKKRILEHISRSSELNLAPSPKTSKSPTSEKANTPEVTSPTPEISPMTENPPQQRKREIMSHLNRSSADFASFSLSSESRKKQIQEHIRKSID